MVEGNVSKNVVAFEKMSDSLRAVRRREVELGRCLEEMREKLTPKK